MKTLTQSVSLKLAFVLFLSFLMLVPLVLVQDLISEREGRQHEAKHRIASRWGHQQSIAGPVLLFPRMYEQKTERGLRSRERLMALVPDVLDIRVTQQTEVRYLGMYEAPVYLTDINISGELDWRLLRQYQPVGPIRFWVPVTDVRGLRAAGHLRIGQQELPAEPLAAAGESYSGLQFSLPDPDGADGKQAFSLSLRLAGSEALYFLPLAERISAAVDSDWQDPEFVGEYLPVHRQIGADGTQASWQLLGLNRSFASHWWVDEMPMARLQQSAFGMRLEIPVDIYQQNERSAKYGVLFIALTFLGLFLFEVIYRSPLHPIQYGLCGAALAIFYVLLLALSEHLGFGSAYLIAAAALVSILGGYCKVVLKSAAKGLTVAGLIGATYALLYFLIVAEQYSLLFGSIALLAVIAAIMYFTRDINWYRYDQRGNAADT